MVDEGDPSRGQQVEGESTGSRNKGGGTSLVGQVNERLKVFFARDRQEKLKQVSGEQPQVFQLLQDLSTAATFQEGKDILIRYRRQYGDYFATPRFLGQDGTPKNYAVRELLILLQSLIDGNNIPPQQIPRPILDLCAKLRPSSQPVERRGLGNYIECTDQRGRSVRIPYEVVLKTQSEQGVQLSRGSRIMYGEGYKNTDLIIPERKATDQSSIVNAVSAAGYYWVIPHRVAADRLPIIIRVSIGEYQELYRNLPPVYRKKS